MSALYAETWGKLMSTRPVRSSLAERASASRRSLMAWVADEQKTIDLYFRSA